MSKTPSPLQQLDYPLAAAKNITVWVKRDDLIHEEIMGNKWRKLKYNLKTAKAEGYHTLLTFGGAYSNHIAATAAAARIYGFKSIGIIRGDELNENSNVTLQKAAKDGMEFRFVSRTEFREAKVDLASFAQAYPDAYVLPEGGTNELAIKGAAEIVGEISEPFDYIVCPIGTGGTMAGILSSLGKGQTVVGISSLKGNWLDDSFEETRKEFGIVQTNYEIHTSYHFGGYAKTSDQLIQFINTFKSEHDLPLDPVYTGKSFYALNDLIEKGHFPGNSKIVALHTGGLQGIQGFNHKQSQKIL